MLTQEIVRELLEYDQQTGLLRWKRARSNVKAGAIAGTKRKSGYIQVQIGNKLYRAHIVIWMLMTGSMPKHFIDHINMDKEDNRWINLREATKSQNMANRGPQKNSSSGIKGVFWSKRWRVWTAQVWKAGKAHFGGNYPTKEEAAMARASLAEKLFGEFARTK